jgi:hypothetical protein
MIRLYRFALLPYGQKKLLSQSLLLVLAVRIGLWALPFTTLDRLLNRICPVADNTADWVAVRRVAGCVRISSRFVPYATCLTQALATRVLLRMAGQPSDLKIGVEKDENEEFGAHAWIEVDGRA